MQAINIAAYQRLKDSYAGEIIPPSEDIYENLDGNSDSEEGYQTAADSEADAEAGKIYQELDGENHIPESENRLQDGISCGASYQSETTFPNDYQTGDSDQAASGQIHGAQASYNSTANSSYHADNPTNNGYFRLEGFSEFSGNLESLKVSQIGNGCQEVETSPLKSVDAGTEKQKLWEDPLAKIESEDDFEVAASCYLCTFRGLLKMSQIVLCVVALSFGLTSRFWVESAVGIWFIVVNVFCAVIAASVLMAQTYGEMDRCCLCRRKLIQILYLLMIPMLLSAGLLAASLSSSLINQPLSDKTMVMVSSMFTLIALFAVITDVVMHRRMWNMFQMAGGNAYIHAAFMA